MPNVGNVSTTVKDNKLTIEIDLSRKLGPSSTGKTQIVASTGGGAPVEGAPDGFKLNLAAWVPK